MQSKGTVGKGHREGNCGVGGNIGKGCMVRESMGEGVAGQALVKGCLE